MTLTLITLGFSPGMATPAPQGVQSAPGIEVVVRYDDRYNPYHVPPPEQTKLGIQSASFTVNWNPTGAGRCSGTLSPWPSEAQTAFYYAVGIWASLLNSSQTIEVDACWRSDLGPGVLGSCGPTSFQRDFPNAPVANTWYPVALANALENTDLYSGPEIRSNLSSTFSWYFGTDGNTPPTQLDFVSVVLHELGHGVGFVGSMNVSGSTGSWGFGTGYPAIYDRFAEDNSGTPLLNYTNGSTALANALTSGNVFFDGPNANAANSGTRVELYAPNPWVSGSSYSHLDESFNNTPNALMTWSFSLGESVHSPGPVMLGMFQDMSWSVSSGCGDTYEPDDSYASARSITVNGAAQTHNFHEAGDEDWVEFTVTAGEAYTMTTSNLGASADTILELYDTNGTTQLRNNDDCPGSGRASCINNWSDSDSGTYFIKVRQWGGTGGCTGYNYDLRVVGGSGKVYLPIVLKSPVPSSFEDQLISLINAERSSRGLGTLSKSSILMQVAEAHSQDMHDRDFFDHVNPDGLGPGERLTNAGYNWSALGENIGCGQSTPQAIFDRWMSSAAHRDIMLSATYTEIGVGYVAGGTCGHYWTAVFARPR